MWRGSRSSERAAWDRFPVPTLFLAAVAMFCYWWLNQHPQRTQHLRGRRQSRRGSTGGHRPGSVPVPAIRLQRVLRRACPGCCSPHCSIPRPFISDSTPRWPSWPRRSWAAPACLVAAGPSAGTLLGVLALGMLSNGMDLLGRLYLLPDRHSRGDPGRGGGHRQLLHEPPPGPDAAAGARGVGLPCGEKGGVRLWGQSGEMGSSAVERA